MDRIAVVTGADRGLGLALTAGLLERGWRVFAGQYMPEWPELQALARRAPERLSIVGLDVASASAVRAAAPALAALILATLILGLIGRTLPQLNVLALGFGANSLLAFATGAVTFGIVVWAFADQIALALELIFDSLKTPLRMEWLA